MVKKAIFTTFAIVLFSGCVNNTIAKKEGVKTNITEKECKKMLGEENYNLLNNLYGDKTAAMAQCLMRINEPEKFKK